MVRWPCLPWSSLHLLELAALAVEQDVRVRLPLTGVFLDDFDSSECTLQTARVLGGELPCGL